MCRIVLLICYCFKCVGLLLGDGSGNLFNKYPWLHYNAERYSKYLERNTTWLRAQSYLHPWADANCLRLHATWGKENKLGSAAAVLSSRLDMGQTCLPAYSSPGLGLCPLAAGREDWKQSLKQAESLFLHQFSAIKIGTCVGGMPEVSAISVCLLWWKQNVNHCGMKIFKSLVNLGISDYAIQSANTYTG